MGRNYLNMFLSYLSSMDMMTAFPKPIIGYLKYRWSWDNTLILCHAGKVLKPLWFINLLCKLLKDSVKIIVQEVFNLRLLVLCP